MGKRLGLRETQGGDQSHPKVTSTRCFRTLLVWKTGKNTSEEFHGRTKGIQPGRTVLFSSVFSMLLLG